jgi:hypothetical protein
VLRFACGLHAFHTHNSPAPHRDIILHKFDTDDEDQVNLYISLLRSLSLRLNEATVQLFFHAPQDGDKSKSLTLGHVFPLFTQAIAFLDPKFDIQQRISIRTITLKVFSVNHAPMRQFLIQNVLVGFFQNCIYFTRDQVSAIKSCMYQEGTKPNPRSDAMTQCVRAPLHAVEYCDTWFPH